MFLTLKLKEKIFKFGSFFSEENDQHNDDKFKDLHKNIPKQRSQSF